MSSVPATATEAPVAVWLPALLQAADSFYPTGAYAHSFGLEGLVQQGVVHDRASLREFLLGSVLPALRGVELPLAACAWAALAGPDWERVGRLCALSAALRPAREARLASANLGRQRVDLLAALRAAPLAIEFRRRAAEADWPGSAAIAAALEGRVAGAPPEAMLAGVCHGALTAHIAAAMKLLRLGQNGAQGLLAELLAHAPGLIAAARAVPEERIGWFNPWLDIASARHGHADARLFIS
ncbi:MAG: urease accessory protein UreF [Verrucomicrobiota bacterium]